MKNFIKSAAWNICCLVCNTLGLVIMLLLGIVITVIEILVTLMHYLHAGFTWITVTILRKINCNSEDKLELECSIKMAIFRYNTAYLAMVDLFHMMAKSDLDDEIFEESEEA